MQRSSPARAGTTVIFALAITLAVSLLPSSTPNVSVVAAADASSDIPGVPLPGPIAAGRLGGAIYDVVYRLSVPAGFVIVASLSGPAETDFDLYLFDASATTVLSNTGLVTKSTGPTSSESIVWPSQFGGTYYIDLNGATDIEGDYRLTVQTVPDATPPAVSISLAGGRSETNQTTVAVALNAIDDLSGVALMAFSSDGITYENWRLYQPSSTWTFLAGDGPQTLWVKVRNGVGLESAPVQDSVVIDTAPPVVSSLDPPPGSFVVGLRPTFSVAFNEPMDAVSWNASGLIVQSATGALVAGKYAYDPATRIGSFVPSQSLQAGVVHVVTVGNVTDVAGNRVSPTGSWTVTPLVPTSLTATASPKAILRGGSTRIDLVLAGAPLPAVVEVTSSTSSGASVGLTPIGTDNGRNSLLVSPASNTTYRFRYPGVFGVASAQVDVPVLVRRAVTLVGRDSAVVSKARVGSSVKLVTAIGPSAPGVSVSFRLYRFDANRRAWVYAGSRGRSTDGAGRASFTWVPPSSGSWYVRAAVASTPEFANNITPVYRWSITR